MMFYPILSILLSIGALVLLIVTLIKLNKKNKEKYIPKQCDFCNNMCKCDFNSTDPNCMNCWSVCSGASPPECKETGNVATVQSTCDFCKKFCGCSPNSTDKNCQICWAGCAVGPVDCKNSPSNCEFCKRICGCEQGATSGSCKNCWDGCAVGPMNCNLLGGGREGC